MRVPRGFQKTRNFQTKLDESSLTRADENANPGILWLILTALVECGPRWVLGYLTVNETGPAGVQEPTIGAARPEEEHLARNTGPPTEGE
jgi:hypothetical protein